MAASSVIYVKHCLWTVCGCKYIANKSYHIVKQINSNWGTFSVFNIIETPRNYFTREVLLYTTISVVMWLHFNVKSLAAILGGKLFGRSVLPAQFCPCG